MSLIAIAITYTLGGLLFALAFEAGEGDVREVAPGKMTSLDAFLRGKFFSRNVARALLSALTIAGWFLLLDGVFGLMRPASTSAMVRDALKLPFFRYPLLTIFMSQAITVTLIPATALLLPLAFVQRHVRRPRLRNVLLVAAVLLGCTLHTTRYTSFFNVVLGVLIPAACLLIGFLAVDFLTAVASLVAFEIAHSMSQLAALSPSWVHIGYGVAVIAAAIIAAELWAAFHGREYHDSEVRPLYARNIVERQRLQAEVAAAREAQLHLLPKSAPDIAGVSISAACIPARVVGGDFYDFFRLGDNRLGIFIAEGGNRGVASALNIALAKGFLMHTVRRGLPPHEIVTRLQAALGAFISGASASTYVAYAVLDTSVGRLSYARTGEYPKVLLSSKLVNERRVEIVGTEQFVYEGEVELRGGDTVLLVTDGIARKVRLGGSASAGDVLRALERKRRSTELDDDLTAVVVRIERVGSAVGVVA
jgi:sigma-B regulation protein RsbU (phosphoserine phosphatase)